MAAELTGKMKEFLNEVFPAIIALKRTNGSIQLIPVWFEYRDGHIWLNSSTSRRWPQHLKSHGRIEMLLLDPEDMFRWLKIRGHLVEITTEGADEHIDRLSHRYTGNPRYQNRQPGEQRIIVKVEPVNVSPSWGAWD
jgi:general stress protein 26